LLSSGRASAAPALEPFGQMVGLQVKFAQGQEPHTIRRLDELKVRWVRDHIAWSTIEPIAGSYRRFDAELTTRFDFYKRHGIGVVLLLGLSNSQAYPPTADDPTRHVNPVAFGRYAVELAKMVHAAGVDFVLEVWNEPHGHSFELFDLFGGNWNGAPPSPWLDHYLKLVGETVRQVKAYDAAVKVITDDDIWVVHHWFLEGGLPKDLDGFGVHPYTHGIPEKTAVPGDVPWGKPFHWVDDDRSLISATRLLAAKGKKLLGRTPEIWFTEWGWNAGEKGEDGEVLSEEVIAGYLPRAYVVAAAAGVKVLCWFSSQDTVDGHMGLVTNDGRERPAYAAFRQMVGELGELRYASHVVGSGRPTRGLQAHRFDGRFKDKLVVWSTEAGDELLRIDDQVRVESVVDRYGKRVSMKFLPTGEGIEVSLASAPLYVTLALTGSTSDHTLSARRAAS